MNIKRGFFRFWILASIIWLISFGFAGANDVYEAIAYWTGTANVSISSADGAQFHGVQFGEELVFPVNTPIEKVEDSIRQGIANGKVTVKSKMARLDQIWRALRKANNAGDAASVKVFTDEIARIRDTLLPAQQAAYDELARRDAIGTDATLPKYRIVEMPPPFYNEVTKRFVLERAKLRVRAGQVLNQIGVVLLVPLLVLVFGWSVAWMLRGFRPD